MKKIISLFCLLLTLSAFSQKNINDYKYVIVPEKFEFQKEAGEYNLNELTKMIFEKQGFTAFLSNAKLSEDLAFDRCKLLYADVTSESSMFKTTLIITLKDCSNNILFTSDKGSSKEKELKRAYYEALREASRSLEAIQYEYKDAKAATVNETAKPKTNANVDKSLLFAQPIKNGYQLVDSTPKVVLKMYKTSQPNTYIATAEGKTGIVLKDDDNWFFQYYHNEELVIEKLNIKF